LYAVEVTVCLEVQKQPKLVIHPTYKHKTDAQSPNGNTWVRFPHQKWCHSHLLSSLTDVEAN